MSWWRDRSLTLVLMALFVVCTAGQMWTGWLEYNDAQVSHRLAAVSFAGYLGTGHPWEALFENWESEFLQMAAFVLLTTRLVQKGSPESRRRGVREAYDADPREHRDTPGAPWPVRRGGIALALYEHSLSLTLLLLFAGSWIGHALGGFSALLEFAPPSLTDRAGQSGILMVCEVLERARCIPFLALKQERHEGTGQHQRSGELDLFHRQAPADAIAESAVTHLVVVL